MDGAGTVAVKLHSLLIKAVGSTGKGPRLVKLFTNCPSLGFSEAQDDPPLQQFELQEADLEEGATLVLKYALMSPVCPFESHSKGHINAGLIHIQAHLCALSSVAHILGWCILEGPIRSVPCQRRFKGALHTHPCQ